MPAFRRSSRAMPAWVMEAGWLIRVSTPPRETARPARCTRSIMARPASRPPFSSKAIIEPGPAIWRLASSNWGWLGSPT